MTRTFLETLEKLGHTWELVDRRFSRSVAEIGNFSFRKLTSAIWMPLRLIASVIRSRPDVVVFFATNRTLSFLVDCVLATLLRFTRKPTILYLHTFGYGSLADRGPIWEWLVTRLFKVATTVVTLGPSLAPDISRWVDESQIKYVANTAEKPPLEITAVPDRSGLDAGQVVLYLSNLIPEKGADVFVDTALEISQHVPATSFVVAGAETDRDFHEALIARVAASEMSHRFLFTGPITDSASKWKLLQDASVLCFPSTYPFEAQPLTILEALSVGTPVVAFDVGGIRDVVRDGLDGFVVPAGDQARFSAAVLDVINVWHFDPQRANAIRASYEERFSDNAYTQNWQRVLLSTIDSLRRRCR